MRTFRPFALILGLLLSPLILVAQSPAIKDSTALAVLSQMAAATGWNQLTVPSDAVATGTVIRSRGNAKDTVGFTLKAKGLRLERIEVQEGTGTITTIVNGDRAAVLKPEGVEFIPPHAVITMRSLVFPFLSDVVALSDGDVNLRYLGTETVGSERAYKVEIAREPAADDPMGELRHRATRLSLWVSTATWLPLQLGYTVIANDNPSAEQFVITSLSDYHLVDGLAIPFHQEESANNRRIYTLQLTGVVFNVGLSDAEFALPANP